MSIECYFGPAFARLTMNGPLTSAMVLDMRRQFRIAVDYYKHDLIEVEIESPGGDAGALRALTIEMQLLLANGCAIKTTAMMEASSAAALTLAMGTVGMRTVQPYTNLLFHNARATPQGERALTAAHALAAAAQLQRLDAQVAETFVSHLTNARGGPKGLATAGLTRCRTLQYAAATVARELGSGTSITQKLGQKGKTGTKNHGWLQATITAYEHTLKSGKSEAYSSLLSTLFAMDEKMPSDMAWALQLIDCVDGSSVLQPEVEFERKHGVVATTSTKMRVAA